MSTHLYITGILYRVKMITLLRQPLHAFKHFQHEGNTMERQCERRQKNEARSRTIITKKGKEEKMGKNQDLSKASISKGSENLETNRGP